MTADLQPYERLIFALADGAVFTEATRIADIKHAEAMREAKAFGWPDRTQIKQAAADLRGVIEETAMPPRKTREPIPLEPDVEQAMTAGAALIEEARASIALDRDQTHDVGPVVVTEVPYDLDPVVDRTDELEYSRGIWRPDGITDEDVRAIPEVADVQPIRHAGVDQLLIEETAATLQTLERVISEDPLSPEQRARSVALTEAIEMVRGVCAPEVGELLTLADYIITGTVPVVMLAGSR